jgi:hypothetical protein
MMADWLNVCDGGISDYTIVGVGNTMRETLTSFKTFTIWQIIK